MRFVVFPGLKLLLLNLMGCKILDKISVTGLECI